MNQQQAGTHARTIPSPAGGEGQPASDPAGRPEVKRAGPAAKSGGEFNLGVHGARGLFAFSVVVYHVVNSGLPALPAPDFVSHWLFSLKFGVELFFAISGFVIAGTMVRARTPLRFLVNRATRIFPVLWAGVLAVVVLSLISGREDPATLAPLPLLDITLANMLALPPLMADLPVFLPPAWTLSYEFTFYLICFAYLVGQRRGIPLFWPALALGAVIIAWHPRALYFLAGLIVAARWLDSPWLDRLARAPLVATVVFLAAWTFAGTFDPPFFTTVFVWGPLNWLLAAVAFAAATLALHGIAKGHGLLGAVLRMPLMTYLGTISYSLYLWHPVVIGIAKPTLIKLGLVGIAGPWSQVVFFLIVIGPAIVVAHISHRVLETGVTEYLRRASRRALPAAAGG